MTVEYEPDSPTSICSIPTKFESESLTSRLTFSSITGLAIPEMNIASLFWYVCFPAVTETLVIISAGAIIIDFTVTMNAVAIWFSELSFAKHVTVVEPIGKKLPEWGLHFGAIDNFKSRISEGISYFTTAPFATVASTTTLLALARVGTGALKLVGNTDENVEDVALPIIMSSEVSNACPPAKLSGSVIVTRKDFLVVSPLSVAVHVTVWPSPWILVGSACLIGNK